MSCSSWLLCHVQCPYSLIPLGYNEVHTKCCSTLISAVPLQEQEAFAKAASLDTHKALVHIFFAQRSTKKVKGVTDAGLKARKVRKVAVIGGGLMGSGIATAGLLAGQDVIIKEVNDKFLQVRVLSLL